ncbi:RNA-binding domain-containing protein [Rickenella mellea]|uniref:Multiple RNA-binding domain-containing protein 1 n=1 Tax=Rickenella mellea TaxID=50990 RepID=A0A4Y7QHW3_9AGAM|nr:RNA-binding domain-containing protein [Rickenella mellea]
MSRLIIKNIPSYVTPERLKDHFSQKNGPGGTITDAKVASKSDGSSRRFGFVGFKTEQEAQRAREWFDRTFIDTTKISVQVVEGSKDAPAPRPNKRPRLGPAPGDELPLPKPKSSAKVSTTPVKPQDKDKGTQLDEFLQVMQPRTKKGRSWANEDNTVSVTTDHPPARPDVKATAEKTTKDAPTTDNTHDSSPDNNEAEEENAEIDDMEWMKRRMKQQLEIANDPVEKVFEQEDEDDAGEEHDTPEIGREEDISDQDPAKATILQTSRLFLRNLAFACSEDDIRNLFSRYGDLVQVHIALDPATKSSKGLAFVKYVKPECAVAAYEALDKVTFQGRLLHILPAVDRNGNERATELSRKPKTVKAEKEKKRKDMAGREFNWSMLYMNSDAVASSIADRMNISKADILNSQAEDDNTSPAVKLALAETHIIQETKNYLESEGINISTFSSMASDDLAVRQRRSDTCILVKNIPYGTSGEQIRELFEPHGELSRVLVPPAGTIAIVDFIHPDEASKAFKAVSYRRLGSSIVYLEKAPVGVFEESKRKTKVANTNLPSTALQAQDEDEDSAESVPTGSTLFVKNLSFATTAERLTQVFRHLPSFSFARVQTKPDPKSPGTDARLSMGYGFVGFKSPDAAKKAMKSLHGFVLDGHSLNVKFAGRGVEEDEVKGKEKVVARTTKMIVKNVPFEATKKDIRELFGAHGQLKSVRLPKKFDSRSRGFAFLDFLSRHEAENAYAALRHTHLLGRHLVLEWAEDAGQDVDLLRKKAGVGHGGGAELPGKKRKVLLGDGDDDAVDEEM